MGTVDTEELYRDTEVTLPGYRRTLPGDREKRLKDHVNSHLGSHNFSLGAATNAIYSEKK